MARRLTLKRFGGDADELWGVWVWGWKGESFEFALNLPCGAVRDNNFLPFLSRFC